MENLESISLYSFVYCLAGKGSRFTKVGINQPKYLLKLDNNEEIIYTSLKSFNFKKNQEVIFIINQEHEIFINELDIILKKTNLKNKIITTGDTRGQAETAFLSLNYINHNDWIFFFNGDTVLHERNINEIISSISLNKIVDGYIDIFKESSNNYSYVKVDSEGFVDDIKEKVVISNSATTGLYGFKSKELFLDYYKKLNFDKGEVYISDLYKLMIEDKKKIITGKLFDKSKTIILGTPEEFNSNKSKF